MVYDNLQKSVFVVLLILVIGMFVFMLSDPDETITGHATFQKISLVKAGEVMDVKARDVTGLDLVYLTFKGDSKGETIQIKQKSKVNFEFTGKTYSEFEISFSNPESIEKVDLNLKILRRELQLVPIHEDKLEVYNDGKKLVVNKIKEEDGYLYYSVADGAVGDYLFGQAAAVVAAPEEEIIPSEPEEELVAYVEEVEEEVEPEVFEPSVVEKKFSLWDRIRMFFLN